MFTAGRQLLWLKEVGMGLTVNSDSDFRFVAAVGDLPNVESLCGCIREETEEEDDRVGWWQTLWVNLPAKITLRSLNKNSSWSCNTSDRELWEVSNRSDFLCLPHVKW